MLCYRPSSLITIQSYPVKIVRLDNMEKIKWACGMQEALACAGRTVELEHLEEGRRQWHSLCTIYMPTDSLLRHYNHTYDVTLRHEMGHCNGWKGDHKGGRLHGARRNMEAVAESTRHRPTWSFYGGRTPTYNDNPTSIRVREIKVRPAVVSDPPPFEAKPTYD
jgi:hypothetical protein